MDELCKGKKYVIIDGVGYPSVGSIVGVSNANVAAALKCDVILIGKQGAIYIYIYILIIIYM